MGVGAGLKALVTNWNKLSDNLEDQILPLDFFRLEYGYDPEKPLVVCKDGGLMCIYEMAGLDPEPISERELDYASNAIRRAVESFAASGLEPRWKGGTFEVQQYYLRQKKGAPVLEKPHRKSEVLEYLSDKLHEFWEKRVTFDDRLFWVVKFYPKFKDREWLRLRSPRQKVVLYQKALDYQAEMLRRHLKIFEENVNAFSVQRPRMGFGLKPLTEEGAYKFIFQMVNKRTDDPAPFTPTKTLLSQIAYSSRIDVPGRNFAVNDRPAKILTWKNPPQHSMPNTFARFQKNCQFPFMLCQIFKSVDFADQSAWLKRNMSFGTAIASTNRGAREWVEEATEYENTISSEGGHPFNWYFSVFLDGANLAELQDHESKMSSQMKVIFQAEPLEESSHRLLAELSMIPGNGVLNQRRNVVTSKNVGQLATIYRLGDGDARPHMLFGDRKNGVFAYSVFTPREPSWNKAVLGLPGSGKTVLIGQILRSVLAHPCQIYVIDKGNSYGPFFEFLKTESPELVSVQRYAGGDFQFNPLPLVWALQEKARQEADGTYHAVMSDGSYLPCPVEAAREFFEGWVSGLIAGDRAMLTPTEKNRLDRALKGSDASGNGGFLRNYEMQCRTYIKTLAEGREIEPPQPLTDFLTFIRNEAPDFEDTIELWTRGKRGKIFDSGKDTLSQAKYCYFELEGIQGDPLLAAPFVSALMGSIWAQVTDPRNLRERKVIVIDEAWSFLSHPAFASSIDLMFRTIRKYNGFVVLATQTPQDIMKGKARELLQCMSEQFIYPGFSEPVYFKEDLLMGQHQIDLHTSLRQDAQRREVLYWTKSGLTRVLDVVLAPEDYWVVTTNAIDKDLRNIFSAYYGSLRAGLEKLVEACGGATIPHEDTRIMRVRAFAERHGITLNNSI